MKNFKTIPLIKQIIRDITPPIITRYLDSNDFGHKFKKFTNFNEALKECTTDAYEEVELIEVIFKKTKLFASKLNSEVIPVWETSAYSLLSIINPLISNLESKTLNILDFGGACGAHYFHTRALLDKSICLNWNVVETNTMVKYAKELETNELKFHYSIKDVKLQLTKIDLLLSSGTLQYVDDPHKYLIELLNTNAHWLLFNRLGLNKLDRDVITVQSSKLSWNGVGELPEGYNDRWVKYPYTFISEKSFLDELKKKYSIVARFEEKSGMYNINNESITGYGLLCRIKE